MLDQGTFADGQGSSRSCPTARRDEKSLRRLAKDAGFDSVHQAILSHGMKPWDPEVYDEIRDILLPPVREEHHPSEVEHGFRESQDVPNGWNNSDSQKKCTDQGGFDNRTVDVDHGSYGDQGHYRDGDHHEVSNEDYYEVANQDDREVPNENFHEVPNKGYLEVPEGGFHEVPNEGYHECLVGTCVDGDFDGYADGYPDGYVYGYNDAYNDGGCDGYPDGYVDGYKWCVQ
ncbi:hypothetical protein F5Y15DRAFT_421497 [Xylariaceae sp. FL0016]|nr:hypothetical protein F5Y15DRAFT_421497 [Xylariaceae sp. FL0016]